MLKRLLHAYRGGKPQFQVPRWGKERGYDLFPCPDPSKTSPLILALHGYTHDGQKMRALTSPDGTTEHPQCFDRLANARGFSVAYPYGSRIRVLPGRCWAAGGGEAGYAPVGDPAVRRKLDDVRYLQNLLEHLESSLDFGEIFLVGISNGGAMAQRLAVDLPGRWAGVATVAGCNQYCAARGLAPSKPVPLLHIHGTADKVWPYEGGSVKPLGLMESVERSIAAWVAANSGELKEETLVAAATPEDPTSVKRLRYEGEQPTELYVIEEGGHAWPGGHQYMSSKVMGRVSHHLSANQTILDFFQQISTKFTNC